MNLRFWIPGPLPGMNEIIEAAKGCGGRGMAYSAMKSKWTNDIALLAMAARLPKGLARIRIEFEWVSVNRQHDPDNIEAAQKFVWDAFCSPKKGRPGAGIIANDGWDQNAGSSHRHTIGDKPGVWVTVVDCSVSDGRRANTPLLLAASPRADGRYQGTTPKE